VDVIAKGFRSPKEMLLEESPMLPMLLKTVATQIAAEKASEAISGITDSVRKRLDDFVRPVGTHKRMAHYRSCADAHLVQQGDAHRDVS